MNTHDTDDGWSDLARELGIEPPPQQTLPLPEEESEQEFFDETEALADDLNVEATAEAAGDEETESEVEGEGDEPKKKRRRRRRRRKANGEPETEGEANGTEDTDVDSEETEAAEVIDTGDPETASVAATRALIDTWDVPSWETIVTTMLHRPTR